MRSTMPRAGLEPARAFAHGALNATCMPISPPRLGTRTRLKRNFKQRGENQRYPNATMPTKFLQATRFARPEKRPQWLAVHSTRDPAPVCGMGCLRLMDRRRRWFPLPDVRGNYNPFHLNYRDTPYLLHQSEGREEA